VLLWCRNGLERTGFGGKQARSELTLAGQLGFRRKELFGGEPIMKMKGLGILHWIALQGRVGVDCCDDGRVFYICVVVQVCRRAKRPLDYSDFVPDEDEPVGSSEDVCSDHGFARFSSAWTESCVRSVSCMSMPSAPLSCKT
jgi:hypothetical protein